MMPESADRSSIRPLAAAFVLLAAVLLIARLVIDRAPVRDWGIPALLLALGVGLLLWEHWASRPRPVTASPIRVGASADYDPPRLLVLERPADPAPIIGTAGIAADSPDSVAAPEVDPDLYAQEIRASTEGMPPPPAETVDGQAAEPTNERAPGAPVPDFPVADAVTDDLPAPRMPATIAQVVDAEPPRFIPAPPGERTAIDEALENRPASQVGHDGKPVDPVHGEARERDNTTAMTSQFGSVHAGGFGDSNQSTAPVFPDVQPVNKSGAPDLPDPALPTEGTRAPFDGSRMTVDAPVLNDAPGFADDVPDPHKVRGLNPDHPAAQIREVIDEVTVGQAAPPDAPAALDLPPAEVAPIPVAIVPPAADEIAVVQPVSDPPPVVAVAAPRKAQRKDGTDDLTIIDGVGPKISAALIAAGVTSFAELARTPESRIREILEAAQLRIVGSVSASIPTWSYQAQLATADRFTELAAWLAERKAGSEGKK